MSPCQSKSLSSTTTHFGKSDRSESLPFSTPASPSARCLLYERKTEPLVKDFAYGSKRNLLKLNRCPCGGLYGPSTRYKYKAPAERPFTKTCQMLPVLFFTGSNSNEKEGCLSCGVSNKSRTTRSAFLLNTAKFTPSPQVTAPRFLGLPSRNCKEFISVILAQKKLSFYRSARHCLRFQTRQKTAFLRYKTS